MRIAWTLILLALVGCKAQSRTYSEAELSKLRSQSWREARDYERERAKGWDAERDQGAMGLVRSLWELPGQVIESFSGNTPAAAARKMTDPASADRRRQGINYLSDRNFGRTRPAYLVVYRDLALNDPDETVRMAALRALNRARDSQSVPVFLKMLGDANAWVRLEAAKALANVPDPSAVEPLLARLRDLGETKDVRIAAADALRNFPSSPVAQALIRVLPDRDFAVAWQARRSLWLMSGHDFGYDPGAWLDYVTKSQRPFVG